MNLALFFEWMEQGVAGVYTNVTLDSDHAQPESKRLLQVFSEKPVCVRFYDRLTLSSVSRARALLFREGVLAGTHNEQAVELAPQVMSYVPRLRPVLSFDANDGSPKISLDARAALEPESLDSDLPIAV